MSRQDGRCQNGSRLNDAVTGGDAGLLLELDSAVADPAPLAARLARPWVAAIDHLDRAERLGWPSSADNWLSAHQLRNQMTHGYIRARYSPAPCRLVAGHALVPMLTSASDKLLAGIDKRGWLGAESAA